MTWLNRISGGLLIGAGIGIASVRRLAQIDWARPAPKPVQAAQPAATGRFLAS